jgi:methylene-tetrahydromethanopterin dehydrogenase
MEKRFILHMLTAERHVSPFDVNMACDAGYDVTVPYTNVALDEVASLTQDAIFSRGPKGARRTGIYIGGRAIAWRRTCGRRRARRWCRRSRCRS